ncbi:hypothetical protein BpHYR1_038377 [Brachionus plicatilis]|uniref:Uncharacterized protein n=1 Tax=Brachionus plicatilis TaxID=10195 RepID=A0A3M7R1A2_BRAPC|nr:hypothetical protein BpHYR1_038377 [Brachionus plicatilis]
MVSKFMFIILTLALNEFLTWINCSISIIVTKISNSSFNIPKVLAKLKLAVRVENWNAEPTHQNHTSVIIGDKNQLLMNVLNKIKFRK